MLRQSYIASVRISDSTYWDPVTATERIERIYGTARTGRLGKELARRVWDEAVAPLSEDLRSLPEDRRAYDEFIIERIDGVARLLREVGRGDFGHAQKVVNLFLKDRWALEDVAASVEANLHLPLDRVILLRLAARPAEWGSWTKVASTMESRKSVVDGYLRIQHSFRVYWEAHRAGFGSPIEMEAFWWQPVPLLVPEL
jgi:hypothetical protein